MPLALPDKTVRDFPGIQRNFDKIAESVEPSTAAGTVGNAQLQDDAVDARVLRDDAVTNANRAVTRNHLRDGIVDGSKLDPGLTFGNGSLATDAVDARVIAPDAVTATELRDDAATDGNRAVTRDHIRDGAVNAAKLDAAVPLAKRFAANVGNGAATSIDVVHNFNTKDVLVQVYDNATGATLIEGGAVLTSITRATVNKVTLVFAAAPALAAHRAVVLA